MNKDDDKLNSAKPMKQRLGMSYNSPEVEPEHIPTFAKTSRIIGLTLVVIFVLWGLYSDWLMRPPFEQLLKDFGITGRNREEWSYVLAGILSVVGWYFRFYIGAIFSSIFFFIFNILKKIFKSI